MLHNKCIATASHLALVYSDWASDKDAGCCWACASLYLQTAQHTYYTVIPIISSVENQKGFITIQNVPLRTGRVLSP